MQCGRLTQVFLCQLAVADGQRNLACVTQHSGIANSDSERRLHVFPRLGITSVYVQRPGVSVEREHIVSPCELLLGDLQSLSWFVRVIGVVEDQLAAGI